MSNKLIVDPYCDGGTSPPRLDSASIAPPPFPARKRGKRMSRRKGQNPDVRIGKRADGQKYYFFQYWIDVPGQEERRRQTEVIGPTDHMTKSEAERKKLVFISKLAINSSGYQIPSSATFAEAVKHYRDVFAPRMLRASTFSIADGHIKNHLKADWHDTPIEHITIETVNEWIWKKREQGLSWVSVKNILRTMQRVLSAFSKDKKPPFSQMGLAIPDRDKLQMKVRMRDAVSFSWPQAKKIALQTRKLEISGSRKEQYSTLFLLASASGLRVSELFALRIDDIDFKAGTVRVDESSDQRCEGKIGACKNVAAYRTVLLHDSEGREALRSLKKFIKKNRTPSQLIFHSRHDTPLIETNVLHDGLHPALKALNLPKAGMHAFRHGCNRRWELAGLNPAVLRQQIGHSSASMTARYTGKIPLAQVRQAFSGLKTRLLENMENEVAA
jgi:integrase